MYIESQVILITHMIVIVTTFVSTHTKRVNLKEIVQIFEVRFYEGLIHSHLRTIKGGDCTALKQSNVLLWIRVEPTRIFAT